MMDRLSLTKRIINSRAFDILLSTIVVASGFSLLCIALMFFAFFATGFVIMIKELILY